MNDASIDRLIDGLADDLAPVRPRRVAHGSILVAAGWAVGAIALLWVYGLRPDLATGAVPPVSMLAFWLIAATGLAAIWNGLRMGLPGVGRDYNGWRWAGLAALSLPLAALAVGIGDGPATLDLVRHGDGMRCMVQGLVAGLGVGAALFAWLKAGAPTSPTRAGWVIGLAAGASGATIVALHCASGDVVHIGLWHGMAVLASAMAGRLLLPPLLRW